LSLIYLGGIERKKGKMIYTINLQQKGGRKAKGLEKKENDKNKKERRKRVKTLERERRLDLGYNSSS
jgi:hypothetical protein